MVERLKAAIEKARERRGALGQEGGAAASTGSALTLRADRAAWEALPSATPDAALLRRNRVVNFERGPRFNEPFDLLRTRLLKVCADNGWTRIGVTSPTKGCGKTMLCANLAFSLARRAGVHAVVVDLDLRAPKLSQTLGLSADARIVDFLNGEIGHEAVTTRIGDQLAFVLNDRSAPDAAERLQDPRSRAALSRMIDALSPTIVLYDMAPMLVGDETIGFLDDLDAVLFVAAAGQTRADQIEECDRLLGSAAPLIGVVLNKAEEAGSESYQYDYAAA
jgi:Mrp family chromosome partitioning ATPase